MAENRGDLLSQSEFTWMFLPPSNSSRGSPIFFEVIMFQILLGIFFSLGKLCYKSKLSELGRAS